MRKTDIEFWALSVIERVEKGQPVEDSRVELKSAWIEPTKAARRIAGHANAAHGEPILWLIGLDEKTGVKGANHNDFAEWSSEVKSQFDGISPVPADIAVPYKGDTVVAILFETDRAPYVVKNPSGGIIQFEVPWRDSTSIRSANRTELLKILVPLQKLPSIEVLSGSLTLLLNKDQLWSWHLDLKLYITSMLQAALVIPFHQCFGSVDLGNDQLRVTLTELRLSPPPLWGGFPRRITDDTPRMRSQPDSLTIDGTSTELIISGPGKFHLSASADSSPLNCSLMYSNPIIYLDLRPVESDYSIPVNVGMNWDDKELDQNQIGRWVVNLNRNNS